MIKQKKLVAKHPCPKKQEQKINGFYPKVSKGGYQKNTQSVWVMNFHYENPS